MIKSLQNYLTPSFPNRQNSIKTSYYNSRVLILVSGLSMFALMAGCTGPSIHPELKADPHVMVRRWTLPTHGPFEMGDRGTEYSNPVIFENTLIFGNRSIGLVSLYPTLNQQRWVLPIHGGVVSELTVNKGAIYFGGGDGFLYSVNVDNGRVNWRYDLRNPIVSRPTVSGGRVFVNASDDTIYAFDAGTGKWLWHYRRHSSPSATIYGASAPLVDNNEVLAGLSDGFLVALSLEEGQLKWEKKLHTGNKFTNVNAHPVLENGIIYLPSYDGSIYALKRQGGNVLWRFDAGGSKDAIVDDQHLYLPSSDGSIYSLQKNNGKVLWKFELDGGVPTQIAMTDKYLIVGSTYQYLYVLDKATGKGLYRFNVGVGSGFSGSPAFDPTSQRVYILSGAGNLYSFSLRTSPKMVRLHGATDPYTFSSL
ncbi:MAG: PQQ-binding-like beta-propeller repeat protein [Bdellovibrionia bacterium]